MFGLDTLGEWEDLVLDKVQNKAIFTRYTWSDKLVSRDPAKNATTIKLNEIRHVGVSVSMGLFVVCRDGKTLSFDTRGSTREEIQNHRKEINYFLNMNKMEFLNERKLDPYDRIIATSDSEDECLEKLHSEGNAGLLKNNVSLKFPRLEESHSNEKNYLKERMSASRRIIATSDSEDECYLSRFPRLRVSYSNEKNGLKQRINASRFDTSHQKSLEIKRINSKRGNYTEDFFVKHVASACPHHGYVDSRGIEHFKTKR